MDGHMEMSKVASLAKELTTPTYFWQFCLNQKEFTTQSPAFYQQTTAQLFQRIIYVYVWLL